MVHIIGADRAEKPSMLKADIGGASEYEKGAAASLYNMLVNQGQRIRPRTPLNRRQAQGVSTIISALRAQRDAIRRECYQEVIRVAEAARSSTDIVSELQERLHGV